MAELLLKSRCLLAADKAGALPIESECAFCPSVSPAELGLSFELLFFYGIKSVMQNISRKTPDYTPEVWPKGDFVESWNTLKGLAL